MLYRLITLTCLLFASNPYTYASEVFKSSISVSKDLSEKTGSIEYKNLVAENQKRFSKEKKHYEALIEKANKAQIGHSKGIDVHEGSLVGQIIQNHQNQEIESSEDKEKGLLVFVSFSMPTELLWSYYEQANLYGGRLVIRGLVENSFKKTIKAMQIDNERQLVLDINPRLCEAFSVKQVPAIVLKGGKKADKLFGSISIKHALEEMGATGDLAKLAQEKLMEANA